MAESNYELKLLSGYVVKPDDYTVQDDATLKCAHCSFVTHGSNRRFISPSRLADFVELGQHIAMIHQAPPATPDGATLESDDRTPRKVALKVVVTALYRTQEDAERNVVEAIEEQISECDWDGTVEVIPCE